MKQEKTKKEPGRRKLTFERIVSLFVFFSMAISIVFVAVRIIVAPAEPDGTPFSHVKNEYVLMLAQCILGVVVMLLPSMLERRLRIVIPTGMTLLFVIFLYCAIYLGEVRSFYYLIPHWDSILHAFSGAMLCALGFSFVTLLNRTERVPLNLSPIFVALFALLFAMGLGAVWEIYEYSFDGLLGLNMQKFMLEDGTQLIGRAALADTMKDIIIDVAGALVVTVIGYISLKYKKGWVERFLIRTRKGHSQKGG